MPMGRANTNLLTSLLLVYCVQLIVCETEQASDINGLRKESAGGKRILLTLDDKPFVLQDNDNKAGLYTKKSKSFKAHSDNDEDEDLNSLRRIGDGNSYQKKRRRETPKPTVPTAKPRPDISNKKQVQWFEDTHYYALKASNDDRFRIRHAPIPASGSPWPLPQVYQPAHTVFHLDPAGFKIIPIGENCDILEKAFERIQRNIFVDYQAGDNTPPLSENSGMFGSLFNSDSDDLASVRLISSLNVTVLKECEDIYPQMGMEESYDLEVKKTGASLIAREVWGALRGMETFSQLVYQDEYDRYTINKTYIHDYPRFPHRGILLDTARHYLNKETIITNLEIMAQNKMNVFHWHIVDDQSFPYDSKTFPELTKLGAYDPETKIYTHEDIVEIIEEARFRGIRVVPEFDSPGHTYSWGYGQDSILTPCYDYSKQPDGYYGPINPILKATYRFLQSLFTEILGLFNDKYVHLGGDEVPFDCWYGNPFLNSFIKRNNLSDVRDLLNLYERKLLDIITNIGKQREQGSGYIVWQEVFDNGVKLKPDAIVQVWSGDAFDIGRVTGAGLRALFSTCWYLDYIGYGQDWDKYYKCDQVGQMLDDYRVPNQTLLLGGEACLWTEYADDESILPRLWPRASAAAERLWSNRYITDVEAAAPRIEEQRCRMLRRGLPVGVLSGPGSCRMSKKNKALLSSYGKDWRMSDNRNPPVGDTARNSAMHIGNVYVVDVHAMYVVPLLLIVCVCCVLVFSSFFQAESKSRLIAILHLTPNHFRLKARGLVVAFMAFVVIWCLWTSPMWMHTWENTKTTSQKPAS